MTKKQTSRPAPSKCLVTKPSPFGDRHPFLCWRTQGHAGVHRGTTRGQFYGGARVEWPVQRDKS